MQLTKEEDIKKRWQEYTEELHKKDLNGPENHEVVIIHFRAKHLAVQSPVGC